MPQPNDDHKAGDEDDRGCRAHSEGLVFALLQRPENLRESAPVQGRTACGAIYSGSEL